MVKLGTDKYVTVKSANVFKSVDIFYDKKTAHINTGDILQMRTVPDIMNLLKSYKIQNVSG